jgi:hypothetical protein
VILPGGGVVAGAQRVVAAAGQVVARGGSSVADAQQAVAPRQQALMVAQPDVIRAIRNEINGLSRKGRPIDAAWPKWLSRNKK